MTVNGPFRAPASVASTVNLVPPTAPTSDRFAGSTGRTSTTVSVGSPAVKVMWSLRSR